jgi:hypothetical protein
VTKEEWIAFQDSFMEKINKEYKLIEVQIEGAKLGYTFEKYPDEILEEDINTLKQMPSLEAVLFLTEIKDKLRAADGSGRSFSHTIQKHQLLMEFMGQEVAEFFKVGLKDDYEDAMNRKNCSQYQRYHRIIIGEEDHPIYKDTYPYANN